MMINDKVVVQTICVNDNLVSGINDPVDVIKETPLNGKLLQEIENFEKAELRPTNTAIRDCICRIKCLFELRTELAIREACNFWCHSEKGSEEASIFSRCCDESFDTEFGDEGEGEVVELSFQSRSPLLESIRNFDLTKLKKVATIFFGSVIAKEQQWRENISIGSNKIDKKSVVGDDFLCELM